MTTKQNPTSSPRAVPISTSTSTSASHTTHTDQKPSNLTPLTTNDSNDNQHPNLTPEQEKANREQEERDERSKDFVVDIVLERLEKEPKLSEGDVSWGKGFG